MHDVFILAIIFGTVALIVKMGIDHSLRLKLLEKGQVGDQPRPIDIRIKESTDSSLKWGLVFVLVGAALLVMEILPTVFRDEIVLGVVLIAAGVGFLIYYVVGDFRARKRKAVEAM